MHYSIYSLVCVCVCVRDGTGFLIYLSFCYSFESRQQSLSKHPAGYSHCQLFVVVVIVLYRDSLAGGFSFPFFLIFRVCQRKKSTGRIRKNKIKREIEDEDAGPDVHPRRQGSNTRVVGGQRGRAETRTILCRCAEWRGEISQFLLNVSKRRRRSKKGRKQSERGRIER